MSTAYYTLRRYANNPDRWERVGRDLAINRIHNGEGILVAPGTLSSQPITSDHDGVYVHEIAKHIFEITTPDATVLDTVYYSAAEALDQAAIFLVPLSVRLTGMAKGLRDVESLAKDQDNLEQAAVYARFANDVERILAHYRYEQVKRGERDADGPPTSREPWLDPNK